MLYFFLTLKSEYYEEKINSQGRGKMQRIKNVYEKIGGNDIMLLVVAGMLMAWMTYREITDHFPVIPADLIILVTVDVMYVIILFALIRKNCKDQKNKPEK